MYLVTKEIIFQTLNSEVLPIHFAKGTLLEYKRWKMEHTFGTLEDVISITLGEIPGKGTILEYKRWEREYVGPDFPIEDYVEEITFTPEEEKSINEKFWEDFRKRENFIERFGFDKREEEPYTVQVEMKSSRHDLNKYLKTIPGKNVIDIKPMENNCYLIIYKEIEE